MGGGSLIQFATAITVVVVGERGLVRMARYGRLKCARQDLRCGGCDQITNMGILALVWQKGSNVKISLLAKGSNVKNRKTLDP